MENETRPKNPLCNGGHKTQPDQLCWNCKRCTNPEDLPCPWAADGTPVDGWVAEQGIEYFHDCKIAGEPKKSMGTTYVITQCPLYIKDKPFDTYYEAVLYIADKLDLAAQTVYYNPAKYAKRLYALTGEKIPDWIVNHTEERKLFPKNPK